MINLLEATSLFFALAPVRRTSRSFVGLHLLLDSYHTIIVVEVCVSFCGQASCLHDNKEGSVTIYIQLSQVVQAAKLAQLHNYCIDH